MGSERLAYADRKRSGTATIAERNGTFTDALGLCGGYRHRRRFIGSGDTLGVDTGLVLCISGGSHGGRRSIGLVGARRHCGGDVARKTRDGTGGNNGNVTVLFLFSRRGDDCANVLLGLEYYVVFVAVRCREFAGDLFIAICERTYFI